MIKRSYIIGFFLSTPILSACDSEIPQEVAVVASVEQLMHIVGMLQVVAAISHLYKVNHSEKFKN
jgi:hypothetical protein